MRKKSYVYMAKNMYGSWILVKRRIFSFRFVSAHRNQVMPDISMPPNFEAWHNFMSLDRKRSFLQTMTLRTSANNAFSISTIIFVKD